MEARRLTLVTFGFKYGLPNTNYYFDVSFVKNPAREANFGLHSEPCDEMRSFVLQQQTAQAFLERVVPMIKTLVDCDNDVRVGFGCNSGRHRSQILAEEVQSRLRVDGLDARIVHREEVYQ
jgi:RNase adaptor protein for sRNA GlmZ degradation